MASADLRRLWKLHLIDVAIQDIRNRAAHLDVGQSALKEIEALNMELEVKGVRTKGLSGEMHDLELQQKSILDKAGKFEKQLYGGSIVNPREVESIEKEIAMLKRQHATFDERILELMDLVPAAKAVSDKIEAAIAEKQKVVAEKRKAAVGVKAQLEADFKQKTAARPEAAKEVSPSLLARYEAIRPKHDGIGMAEIVKSRQCGGCGTLLPERTLQNAVDDKVVTCETCHRILYFTEGVV